MNNKTKFKKFEAYLIKAAIIQFCFLVISQLLICNKTVAPYLSRTLFSEGVFFESVVKVVQVIDQAPWL